MPHLGNIEFPPVQMIYPDQQAAHDDMLDLIAEVERELAAEGVKPVSFPRFYREARQLWEIWRLYAPGQ